MGGEEVDVKGSEAGDVGLTGYGEGEDLYIYPEIDAWALD